MQIAHYRHAGFNQRRRDFCQSRHHCFEVRRSLGQITSHPPFLLVASDPPFASGLPRENRCRHLPNGCRSALTAAASRHRPIRGFRRVRCPTVPHPVGGGPEADVLKILCHEPVCGTASTGWTVNACELEQQFCKPVNLSAGCFIPLLLLGRERRLNSGFHTSTQTSLATNCSVKMFFGAIPNRHRWSCAAAIIAGGPQR